jgi:hypothetical protein
MDKGSYQLPFEIECHKQKDHFEFCRVFFKRASPFPRYLLFGMDNGHFAPYKQFMEDNAGMVVNRSDKLNIHVSNKRTLKNTCLVVDLEPYWPADLGPGEIKASLAEIDITTAIRGLI